MDIVVVETNFVDLCDEMVYRSHSNTRYICGVGEAS